MIYIYKYIYHRSTIVSVKITNEEADMVADCAIGLMHLCKVDIKYIKTL